MKWLFQTKLIQNIHVWCRKKAPPWPGHSLIYRSSDVKDQYRSWFLGLGEGRCLWHTPLCQPNPLSSLPSQPKFGARKNVSGERSEGGWQMLTTLPMKCWWLLAPYAQGKDSLYYLASQPNTKWERILSTTWPENLLSNKKGLFTPLGQPT